MKFPFLFLILIAPLMAVEPPQTFPAHRYYHLWQNSSICDPPVKIEPDKIPNDLKDWALVGTEQYTNANFVTVVNKKNPKERIRIPGPDAGEFAIIEIKKAPGSFLKTEVHLQKGPHRGWVQYDPKYLVLRKAPAPNKGKGKTPNPARRNTKGLPGGARSKNNNKKTTKTPARTRFIPKPNK